MNETEILIPAFFLLLVEISILLAFIMLIVEKALKKKRKVSSRAYEEGRFVLMFYTAIIFLCAPKICLYTFEWVKDFRTIHPIFHLLIPLVVIVLFGYQEFRLLSLLFKDLFTEKSESSEKEVKE